MTEKKAGQKWRTEMYGVVKLVKEGSGGWHVVDVNNHALFLSTPRLKERVKRASPKATTEVIKTELEN